MLYKFSTKSQHLFNFWCLFFFAGNQMHIPSTNRETINKKDCPLPVADGCWEAF